MKPASLLDRNKPKTRFSQSHHERLHTIADTLAMKKTQCLEWLIDLVYALIPYKRKHATLIKSLIKGGYSEGEALVFLLEVGAEALAEKEKQSATPLVRLSGALRSKTA